MRSWLVAECGVQARAQRVQRRLYREGYAIAHSVDIARVGDIVKCCVRIYGRGVSREGRHPVNQLPTSRRLPPSGLRR